MSPDEAISLWRTLSTEELKEALDNKEFHNALNEAGRIAIASGDPKRRFWEVDIDGWRKNQFTVDIPPARPNEDDEFGPGASQRKDTEIEISVEGNSRTARVTKQREYECNGEFSFSLKTVELGANARGKMVTSCVVEHQGDQPKHVPKQRLSAAERRALDVLNNVIASSGRQGDPGVPSGCSSVPEKWWRDAFYESANPGDTLEAKQTAFRRASKTLISNGIVGMGKGRLWCV